MLRTLGLQFRDAGPVLQRFSKPNPWSATIEPDSECLTLTVRFETDHASPHRAIADAMAAQLAEGFSIEFSDQIQDAIAPEPVDNGEFIPDAAADVGSLLFATGTAGVSFVGHAVRLTTTLPPGTLSAALKKFASHESKHSPGSVAAARKMFLTAVRCSNPVERFLVLYAALFVANNARKQNQLDAVIQKLDPAVLMLRSGRGGTLETSFTNARNVFIHAEKRGQNPEAAARRIAELTPSFQALVAQTIRQP